MRSSNLQEARFFKSNLRDTLLSEANLAAAYLSSALMQGAHLQSANLNQAVLRYSMNLTSEQIQSAKIDRKTKVPNYLEIHWVSETEFSCEEKQSPQ
jgi:uncharacterized protein YjbI with pentapeptide repeats